MNDVFLGVIAFGVLVMAIIQVAAVVFAARTARRVGDVVSRLEQDVRPIVANLQTMSSDAARATKTAAVQIERLEGLIGDLSKRVDDTAAAVQHAIVTPARQALAVLHGIMAAFSVFRGTPPSAPRRPAATADDDDALFIG